MIDSAFWVDWCEYLNCARTPLFIPLGVAAITRKYKKSLQNFSIPQNNKVCSTG